LIIGEEAEIEGQISDINGEIIDKRDGS